MRLVDDRVVRNGALTMQDYCQGSKLAAQEYDDGVGKSLKDVHIDKAQVA